MANDVGKMRCPGCKKVIQFPTTKAGKHAKCPSCSCTLTLVDQTQRQVAKSVAVHAPAQKPAADPTSLTSPSKRDQPAATDTTSITPVKDSRLSRFISDGQSEKVVAKLLSRIDEVCTVDENPEYIAVQHLPGVLSPDAIALTNRRVIIFRAKALGRMEMVDVAWLNVANIHIKEGIVGATLSVAGINGHVETIDHLPKKQARCVYRVGQQREEEMREHRRDRRMEEDRNAAGGVVVNAAIGTPPAPHTAGGDLKSRLAELRSMLDEGLIDQQEFDAKKSEILSSL